MSTDGVNPTRRLAPPGWLARDSVRAVTAALGTGRFVGGAVRDTLLSRPIGDLDFATPLLPDEVTRRLVAAGIRAIPTGLDHGTVTALVGKETIEITTLRRDVETDGRHAVVAFTGDWAADAARRDFTMNALYLDTQGGLWDPVGGIEDCLAGRVRFVGEPGRRIDEDVLRLLRFYRFLAHYGKGPADEAARAACRATATRLPSLAGERIRTELFKLLAAPDPVPTLRLMAEDGIFASLMAGAILPNRVAALIRLDPSADPLLRLAALLPATADIATRLKLDNAARDRLLDLTGRLPAADLTADERQVRRALHRLGADRYRDLVLLAAAASGQPERAPPLLRIAAEWPAPALPIAGADIVARGVAPGARVGEMLRTVETWWIDGDFRADRAECLARLDALLTF